MSDRLATRACDLIKARRTTELRAAVEGGNYLREDAEASRLARNVLRNFDDHDLAWIKHLSPVNLAVVCSYFETTPQILFQARQYERSRRKAFPIGASAPQGSGEPAILPPPCESGRFPHSDGEAA